MDLRPQIIEADDVIIRVVRACVCGSDLWRYRNPETKAGHKNSGHEAIGIVAERGQEGITKVREILGGGADAALECVGTEAAIEQALGVLHNGGRMGFVGVPHYNNRALGSTFMQNISVAGGAASATTYDKQFLLKAVLDGDINPGRVFTSSYKLEDIDQAYKDMDERKTIKSMIVIE
ncbi:TPA: zinc-binding dehydrogenase [Streptococcus pneumoniae]|nr:zinc-binding dehydrogenase [Streptococcus pneumoniae]HEV8844170.1 zinc-binding dehydrogenase [Streptococcus pneumoniae]